VTNESISRRQFLHRLGALGGAGIMLGAMDALDLVLRRPSSRLRQW
jgi:hypothetical protein